MKLFWCIGVILTMNFEAIFDIIHSESKRYEKNLWESLEIKKFKNYNNFRMTSLLACIAVLMFNLMYPILIQALIFRN